MPKLGAAALPAVSCLCAVIAAALGFGFTVDDALISTRVAHNIAVGNGYRFNATGPITDCVTPLGWAYLLAPLSSAGTWAGLLNARWLGIACHLTSALVLGWALQRRGVRARDAALSLIPLGLSLPWGAWASSGMETPLVTLLVTATILGGRWVLPCASVAAGIRPELIPWAFALAVWSPVTHPGKRVAHVALVLSCPLLIALIRAGVFGSPAPLSVFAKPSDVAHGVSYVLRGLVLTGVPLLLLSRRSYALVDQHTRRLALGVVAHFGAMVIAGGDWMALFRLFVPLLPTAAFVGAELLANDPRWLRLCKATLAGAACLLLDASYVSSTRGVLDARWQLVQHGADVLTGRVVATLDVGWVGAIPNTLVIDLAGVTDPEVAVLPGGHTSKKLPRDFLVRRDVDTLVLLLRPGVTPSPTEDTDWRELPFARVVEQRIGYLEGANTFVPVRLLPLAGTAQSYLVLHRMMQRVSHR